VAGPKAERLYAVRPSRTPTPGANRDCGCLAAPGPHPPCKASDPRRVTWWCCPTPGTRSRSAPLARRHPREGTAGSGAPSRRTAATSLGFPVATTIELSAQASGNGVPMYASDFPDPVVLPDQRQHAVQTTLMSMGYARQAPRGAQGFAWNSQSQTLDSSWLCQDRSMAWTLAPVYRAAPRTSST
jgi:hypothetical protein